MPSSQPKPDTLRLMWDAEDRKSPARAWMEQEATKGDVGATIMLSMVLMATGTKREKDRGRVQLSALVEQGNPRAEFAMAYAINRGLTPSAEPDEADKLLRRAADHGNRPAIQALKIMRRRPEEYSHRFPNAHVIAQSIKLE